MKPTEILELILTSPWTIETLTGIFILTILGVLWEAVREAFR